MSVVYSPLECLTEATRLFLSLYPTQVDNLFECFIDVVFAVNPSQVSPLLYPVEFLDFIISNSQVREVRRETVDFSIHGTLGECLTNNSQEIRCALLVACNIYNTNK
uniref:CYP6B6 protein n=1 Tax=Fopius arisanus TaxID=64838 RepID=A0A0C9QVE8_9HYME